MILVLLGTQNNSFIRLLEEVEKNIENGNIQDRVVVQAGFTKYKSEKMEIFDMVSQDRMNELIDEADLIITHGGVGSMMSAIRKGKKVIAVPRKKEYGEHVNNHQMEMISTFAKQGLIIGLNDVSELEQALNKVENIKLGENKEETSNIINIIDDYIKKDIQDRKKKSIIEKLKGMIKWKKKEF